MIDMRTVIAGEKEQVLYLVGYGKGILVACNFSGHNTHHTQAILPFEEMTWDYAYSYSVIFILQA
jgi:hypothetical protein